MNSFIRKYGLLALVQLLCWSGSVLAQCGSIPTPTPINTGSVCLGKEFVVGVQPLSGYKAEWYVSTDLNNILAEGAVLERFTYTSESYQVRFKSLSQPGCIGSFITITPAFVDCGDDLNFVRQRTVHTKGITSPSQIPGLNVTKADQVTTYMDGLGRTLQTVNHKASPSQQDVIQPVHYDEYGRATFSYLAYTRGNNGKYQKDAFTAQGIFWNDPTKTNTDPESHPYSHSILEASPLQRVLEQGSVGQLWNPTSTAGGGRTARYSYFLSAAQENIRRLQYNHTNGQIVSASTPNQNYGDRQLSVTEIQTPTSLQNSSTVIFNRSRTYTNSLGQTILQKVYNGTEELDTYQVYDDLGQLRAIIPPLAVNLLRTNGWNLYAIAPGSPQNILLTYCYTFKYDKRGRVIEKTVPGAATMYMVYNRNDQVVLTQDGEQRRADPQGNTRWSFIKYDRYGREIMSGIFLASAAQSREVLQANADNITITFENPQLTIHNYPENLILTQPPAQAVDQIAAKSITLRPNAVFTATPGQGYSFRLASNHDFNYSTDQSFPAIDEDKDEILSFRYYDGYEFIEGGISNFQNFNSQFTEILPDQELPKVFDRVDGLSTGGKVKILNPNPNAPDEWLHTAVFYDDDHRVIQVQSDNHLGGEDIITTQYHFDGREIKSFARHQVDPDGDGTLQTVTITDTYVYDATRQLISVSEQIDDDYVISPSTEVLSELSYGETGELLTKRVGGSGNDALQKIDYRSNIQGWPLSINDANLSDQDHPVQDLFGMEFEYEQPSQAPTRYDGSIAEVRWRSNLDDVQRSYAYTYDALGRLQNADYGSQNTAENFDLSIPAYDLNGNIQSLSRSGLQGRVVQDNPTFGQIDQLTYHYRGNQLTAVDDARESGSTRTGLSGDFSDWDGQISRKSNNGITQEMTYNDNGFLLSDLNQALQSVQYNHLDLPSIITFGAAGLSGEIRYTYDAAGNVLRKVVSWETPDVIDEIQTDYLGAFVYQNDELQFIHTSEGRALPPRITGGTQYAYEYFYTDHQGNLRMSFRRPEFRQYVAHMDNFGEDE
ncbi:MAG: DUF6443 domain-containing protein, partial [Microscillaceae bacterium]|nr:DUF6443 domain-containing protein [Microscillaceae bacterium]